MLDKNWIRIIESSLKKNWEQFAFSDYVHGKVTQHKTYSQVAVHIRTLHFLFEKKQVKIGDKVALLGRNSSNWAVVYLAVISYGAVIVPILPDFHSEDVQHILHHSDSKLLFADEDSYELLEEEAFQNIEQVFSLGSWELIYCKKKADKSLYSEIQTDKANELASLNKDNFSLEYKADNSSLGLILYTSGTSGFSKGVMLPHNAILTNVLVGQEELKYQSGDRMLSFLPVAHAYGAAFDFLTAFASGCHTTFLGQIPSPRILLKAFQDIKPAYIFSVPLILEKIYRKQIIPQISRAPLSFLIKIPLVKKVIFKKIRKKLLSAFGGRFKQVVIGAAALNPEVEKFLMDIGFRFTVGYGMTECGPLISFSHWHEHRAQSVGRAIRFLELKIDSQNPYTVPGEILLKGENLMQGYYKNQELSKEAIDQDGWLHTGDLGVLDRDGFCFIKGRKKDLILGPSGKNIYPEAIESRFNNMPFVTESLVLERNGSLVALIHPDLEAKELQGLEEPALKEKLNLMMEDNRSKINNVLPAYSKISQVKIYWEPFEKTPTRKIKRYLYYFPD